MESNGGAGRQARGKALAAERGAVKRLSARAYTVKSQAGAGSYNVEANGEEWQCSCPDFENRGVACKHVFATRYYLEAQRDTPEGTKVERIRLTHKQAWTAYNAAQTDEVRLFDVLLADLVRSVPEPPHGRMGRPSLPLSEQAFCAIQKVYSQLSSRRARSLFGFAEERGQIRHAPHFNASTNFLNREDATPILHELVRLTALPLASIETDFAVDSTGFRTTTFGAYCEDKHGGKRQHKWLKAHICSGVKTNIVTEVTVTGEDGADSPQFAPLVQATADAGFTVREVSADKAYSGRVNHDAVGAVGGVAYIPFKSNATGKMRGSVLWTRAFHYFQLHRDGFEERYHKRSNVESTIGAIKKKLGETLKSRNLTAQTNELLAKVVAYNITVLIHEMHENGVAPEWLHAKSPGCTSSRPSEAD